MDNSWPTAILILRQGPAFPLPQPTEQLPVQRFVPLWPKARRCPFCRRSLGLRLDAGQSPRAPACYLGLTN